MNLIDKPKHISRCVIAVGYGEQVVLLSSQITQEMHDAGCCTIEDMMREYGEFRLNDLITNDEKLPIDIGIYSCDIELISRFSLFESTEYDGEEFIISNVKWLRNE